MRQPGVLRSLFVMGTGSHVRWDGSIACCSGARAEWPKRGVWLLAVPRNDASLVLLVPLVPLVVVVLVVPWCFEMRGDGGGRVMEVGGLSRVVGWRGWWVWVGSGGFRHQIRCGVAGRRERERETRLREYVLQ